MFLLMLLLGKLSTLVKLVKLALCILVSPVLLLGGNSYRDVKTGAHASDD